MPSDRCIALSNTKTNKTNDTKTSCLILVKTTLHRREKETNILNSRSLSRERKNSKSHHKRVPLKPSTDLSRSLSFGTSSTPSSLTLPPRTLLSRSTFVRFFFMAMMMRAQFSLSRANKRKCLNFQILSSRRRDEFSTKISLLFKRRQRYVYTRLPLKRRERREKESAGCSFQLSLFRVFLCVVCVYSIAQREE